MTDPDLLPADDPDFAAGICAIVGRPNVGKSTLLNAIIGQKIAITTPVPQTTRHAIRGILSTDEVQVVFVDTPGMHKPRTLLGSRLNDVAQGALDGVDLVVFVVDGADGVGRGDRYLADLVAGSGLPMIGVLNKVDRLGRNDQLPGIAALSELAAFQEIVPVSARKGESVDVLVDLIRQRMPKGPALYPHAMVTDSETTTRISEVVREKAMVAMREEVPHSIAVTVDEMGPGTADGVTVVYASAGGPGGRVDGDDVGVPGRRSGRDDHLVGSCDHRGVHGVGDVAGPKGRAAGRDRAGTGGPRRFRTGNLLREM